ncbi:MAG: alpha-amylase family glycosyl hydrolase [Ignavibacteriales bacterium]
MVILFTLSSSAQNFSINKIEPPNWWIGMKWDTVQLMIYGEHLEGINVISENENLQVIKIHYPENNSYLFIDILIPDKIETGNYNLIFTLNGDEKKISYPILNRENSADQHRGFNNEDVVYLIFADRFCDGNPENNHIGDSLDQFTSEDIDGRKGGDIEGIISRLDYLKALGVTSIWVTPMLENNMWMSYHGYAATDLYKIDPRFGSNELYKKLVEESHKRGLKIILDHVSNHIGINHHWIKNLPSKDWLNGSPEYFTPALHDKMAFLDVHGDNNIVKFHQEGWFSNYMPDLNQRNNYLKKYLIQNTIWWIEFSGIDGIREDTYPYNDQKYLAEWAEAILTEYPNFNIVGEIWQGVPSVISGYQTNSPIRKLNFDSNLPSVTDFALADAVRNFLSGEKNIYTVYETIAQDIVYSDANNLVVFIDNHDVDRAMLVADGDIDKFKIALNIILFSRGIPVIFYGTEIGIEGGKEHGELRQPFPGGFTDDESNAFTQEGRTDEENNIFNYLNKLLMLRKEYPVLSKGKLTHFYPVENVYVLHKTYGDEEAIIIITTGEEKNIVHTSQLKIFLPDANTLRNMHTNEIIDLNSYDTFEFENNTAELFIIEK